MPLVFVAFVFAAAALATACICRIHGLSFSDILRTRPLRYGTVATGLPAALAGIVAWWISIGEEEDALALIGSLTREHGRDALALLARPPGPASSLAASLAQKNAYR